MIPLFVRAGSVIPLGADIQNTATAQPLKEIRVYPGRAAEFTLYDDDGVSYDYEKGEKGKGRTTRLRWDDTRKALTSEGSALPGRSIKEPSSIWCHRLGVPSS
jgi:alpha-D-xyloside xylohydrolase